MALKAAPKSYDLSHVIITPKCRLFSTERPLRVRHDRGFADATMASHSQITIPPKR